MSVRWKLTYTFLLSVKIARSSTARWSHQVQIVISEVCFFRIVKDRLREGIACVAIEGSGRAADIISYAYKNAVKNKER